MPQRLKTLQNMLVEFKRLRPRAAGAVQRAERTVKFIDVPRPCRAMVAVDILRDDCDLTALVVALVARVVALVALCCKTSLLRCDDPVGVVRTMFRNRDAEPEHVFPGDFRLRAEHWPGEAFLDGVTVLRLLLIIQPTDPAIRRQPAVRRKPRPGDEQHPLRLLYHFGDFREFLIVNVGHFDRVVFIV